MLGNWAQAQLSQVQQEEQEVDAQLRSLRVKQERLAQWTSQHEHQVLRLLLLSGLETLQPGRP